MVSALLRRLARTPTESLQAIHVNMIVDPFYAVTRLYVDHIFPRGFTDSRRRGSVSVLDAIARSARNSTLLRMPIVRSVWRRSKVWLCPIVHIPCALGVSRDVCMESPMNPNLNFLTRVMLKMSIMKGGEMTQFGSQPILLRSTMMQSGLHGMTIVKRSMKRNRTYAIVLTAAANPLNPSPGARASASEARRSAHGV